MKHFVVEVKDTGGFLQNRYIPPDLNNCRVSRISLKCLGNKNNSKQCLVSTYKQCGQHPLDDQRSSSPSDQSHPASKSHVRGEQKLSIASVQASM